MKAVYVSARDQVGPMRLARRPITEVMSKPAVIVSADMLLDDALVQLVRTGQRHVVTVNDDGRCMGVLTDRSVAATWAADYAALSHRTVATVLDREPAIISVRDTVADAARLMGDAGIDAVAVVDDHGRPVGLVTGSALVSLLAR